MNPTEKPALTIPSAPEYILDNFERTDRIAVLVLNREFGETIQRITNAQKAASPEFQAWLRYKNAVPHVELHSTSLRQPGGPLAYASPDQDGIGRGRNGLAFIQAFP